MYLCTRMYTTDIILKKNFQCVIMICNFQNELKISRKLNEHLMNNSYCLII